MQFRNDHHGHSSMVRHWGARQVLNSFSEEVMSWKENDPCFLQSPHSGYLVQVSFSKYVDHPEYIRVRSTNWRCEHEPSGVYRTEDARQFYAQLKKAGFVVPSRD